MGMPSSCPQAFSHLPMMSCRVQHLTQRCDVAGLRTPTWTEEELDQATQNFCREHGLPEATQQPQIYDAFMFNSELDMLEVRLLELYDFVDYFVICEAPVPLAAHTSRSSCSQIAFRPGLTLCSVLEFRSGCCPVPCCKLAGWPDCAERPHHAHDACRSVMSPAT